MAPFVGNGGVLFDIGTSVNLDDAPGQGTATVDSVNYEFDAVYSFTDAETPEPSLLFALAGIAGLLVIQKLRNRSKTSLSD